MKWSNVNFAIISWINIPVPIYNIHCHDTTTEHCNINETFSFSQMKLRLSPLNLQKLYMWMFKEDCTFMTNAFWLVLNQKYKFSPAQRFLVNLRCCTFQSTLSTYTLPLRSTIYKKEIRNYQTLRAFNKTKNAESAISKILNLWYLRKYTITIISVIWHLKGYSNIFFDWLMAKNYWNYSKIRF